jgi:hypothetical protein
MLDVMMADLPRVDYHNGEEKFSEEEQREASEKTKEAMSKIKQGGLKSIKGLNLNLDNQKSVQSLLNRAKH